MLLLQALCWTELTNLKSKQLNNKVDPVHKYHILNTSEDEVKLHAVLALLSGQLQTVAVSQPGKKGPNNHWTEV
jgi:hypothetical protein